MEAEGNSVSGERTAKLVESGMNDVTVQFKGKAVQPLKRGYCCLSKGLESMKAVPFLRVLVVRARAAGLPETSLLSEVLNGPSRHWTKHRAPN